MSTTQSTQSFDLGSRCETIGCTNTFVGGGRCQECIDVTPVPNATTYEDVDFSRTWDYIPNDLNEREQWMAAAEDKLPFAPWTDENADAYCGKCEKSTSECHHHAGKKWSWSGNYVDGDTLDSKVGDSVDARAFIQHEDDPFSHVDFDNVVDDDNEVHPAVANILDRLGRSFTELSISETGIHVPYFGELPKNVKQASWDLDDEPWGDNDDVPSIEIYDGKRNLVITGNHVRGTPASVHEWDDDALYDLLVEEGVLVEDDSIATPTDEHEDFDSENYDPEVTGRGTTTDIRDVYAALNSLNPKNVAEKTIVHSWNDDASTSKNARAFYPTWGRDSNGTANYVDDRIWNDTGGGGYGGPVVMALLDLGEVNPDTITPRSPNAKGEHWWEGVEHLRDLGFDIPEYVEVDRAVVEELANYIANFPNVVWEDREPIESDDGLTKTEVRDKRDRLLKHALENHEHVLIDALPSVGKSYGIIKNAAETSVPITVFTSRHDLYDQYVEWCEEHDLSYYKLPPLHKHCPTMMGGHGVEWEREMNDYYKLGLTGRFIHTHDTELFGVPIPCDDGHECPIKRMWKFDPEEYDVLIGHYLHASNQSVTENRTIVFDEFPSEEFEKQFDSNTVTSVVSNFLESHDGLPFTDYTDLIETRSDDDRHDEAEQWFQSYGLDPDTSSVLDANGPGVDGRGDTHALAPIMTYALLDGHNLENGWEHSRLELGSDTENGRLGDRVAARNRGARDNQDELHVLCPPKMSDSNGVVCLDGTPETKLWRLVVDGDLYHEQVLSDDERCEYLTDVLGYRIVQTTDRAKHYASGRYVHPEQDGVLFETVGEETDVQPSLISTKAAIEQYDETDVLAPIDDASGEDEYRSSTHLEWYGNLKGKNTFGDDRVGIVSGSTHFGDSEVEKWCALAGESTEHIDGNTDIDRQYTTELGNTVQKNMRENKVFQAIMRFERGDGDGALVFVNTAAFPDWIPVEHEGSITKVSDGMKTVIAAIQDCDSTKFTKNHITDHPLVNLSKKQITRNLRKLTTFGYLTEEQRSGRATKWNTTDDFHTTVIGS